MKIDYDSNTENKHDWKVGDVIRKTNSDFYLVSEVFSINFEEKLYTLVNLENGISSASSNSLRELQSNYDDTGDMILNGTFKYIEEDK